MTFDNVGSQATTLAIYSLISHMAEEYADDQDMDSYWTCISVLTRCTDDRARRVSHTTSFEAGDSLCFGEVHAHEGGRLDLVCRSPHVWCQRSMTGAMRWILAIALEITIVKVTKNFSF